MAAVMKALHSELNISPLADWAISDEEGNLSDTEEVRMRLAVSLGSSTSKGVLPTKSSKANTPTAQMSTFSLYLSVFEVGLLPGREDRLRVSCKLKVRSSWPGEERGEGEDCRLSSDWSCEMSGDR